MNRLMSLMYAGSLLCGAMGVRSQTLPQTPPAAPQAATDAGSAPAPAPPKPTAQSEAGEPRAATSQPVAATSQAAAPAQPAPKRASTAAGPKNPNAADKLELGTATVTGDREQPKVMYIVPWKRSDIGDLEGKPMNSLVDEILSPIDRDVFRREVRYYQTVKSNTPQNETQSTGQGEK